MKRISVFIFIILNMTSLKIYSQNQDSAKWSSDSTSNIHIILNVSPIIEKINVNVINKSENGVNIHNTNPIIDKSILKISAYISNANPNRVFNKWKRYSSKHPGLYVDNLPIKRWFFWPMRKLNEDFSHELVRGNRYDDIFIMISRNNKDTTLAILDTIKFTINGKVAYKYPNKYPLNASDSLCIIDLKQFTNVKVEDTVQLKIGFKDTAKYKSENSNFLYYKNGLVATLYSALNTNSGFWLPVGQFATNFTRTDVGITFAPMPIGLAWGVKFNCSPNFYIGTSLFGSWLLYQQTSTNTNSSNQSNFNFKGATVGLLCDLNNFFTIGLGYSMYTVSFDNPFGANANKSPGGSFVVGIGPGLLNLLKVNNK